MMLEYIWIAWAVLALLSIIVEAATVSLVSIWLIPGEIVAALMAALELPLWSQILTFILLSSVLLAATRKISKKLLNGRNEKTNFDLLIGKVAVVSEEIDNVHQKGAVKIGGKEWTARSMIDDVSFAVGDVVTVKEISGVKLIVF